MIMKDARFRFWRVFWVLLAVYLLFATLGIIIITVTPSATTGITWHKFTTWIYLRDQLISFCFSLVFYYLTLNKFYDLFSKKSTAISFVPPAVISIVAIGIYQFLSFKFLASSRTDSIRVNNKPVGELTTGILIFGFLFTAVFFICVSLLVSYLVYLRDERKQRKILEEQKMQLEVEKTQANLNFLKAQINPHFLHNTLNFLYAKALPLSAELSEGILTLSDMMRYALSEGNTKDGKAPLKDEIEHVRNVIKIQQLRFNNQLNVEFEVEGIVNGATIIPFVLITLVENAFKHGDLKSTANPIEIKVKILSENNIAATPATHDQTITNREKRKLYFYCRNKKKSGPKELSTGIGLQNIKKRLELAYGKNYQFNVKDDGEFYTTELIIEKL